MTPRKGTPLNATTGVGGDQRGREKVGTGGRGRAWGRAYNSRMVRIGVRYTGRVQGVGFRATTRSIARRYPVTGWVRNEEDGSVQAEFQGERAAVESLLRVVRERMAGLIQREETEEVAAREGEAGFEIDR